jgi:hypothetical protein
MYRYSLTVELIYEIVQIYNGVTKFLLNPIYMNTTVPELYLYTCASIIYTPGGNHTYMTQDLTLKQMQNNTTSWKPQLNPDIT